MYVAPRAEGKRAPPQRIPRIVHQVLLSGALRRGTVLPERMAAQVTAWRAQNPEWEHRLYDDDAVEAYMAAHACGAAKAAYAAVAGWRCPSSLPTRRCASASQMATDLRPRPEPARTARRSKRRWPGAWRPAARAGSADRQAQAQVAKACAAHGRGGEGAGGSRRART